MEVANKELIVATPYRKQLEGTQQNEQVLGANLLQVEI